MTTRPFAFDLTFLCHEYKTRKLQSLRMLIYLSKFLNLCKLNTRGHYFNTHLDASEYSRNWKIQIRKYEKCRQFAFKEQFNRGSEPENNQNYSVTVNSRVLQNDTHKNSLKYIRNNLQ